MARRLTGYEGGRAGPSPAARQEVGEESALPPPDGGVPEPTPLSPDDVVPLLRSDLVTGPGGSPALVEVADPASGRRFQIYDFELVVARMLDGRRRASDVIENAKRLGLPVDAHGLFVFVRQLWRYGFLAPVPPEVAEGAGPAADGKWSEATGTLFQSGLRMMRLGRPADAQGYFEAVLDAEPANAEAKRLLALAQEEGARPAARSALAPAGLPAAAAPAPPGTGAAEEAAPPGTTRSRRVALLAVAVALVALAAAGVLVGVRRPGAGEGGPGGGAAAAAGEAETGERPAQPGAAGTPAPAVPAPPPRTAPVDRRSHPPLAAVVAPVGGLVVWEREAGAAVAKGERVGAVRAGRNSPGPAARRRLGELEALAARDPVYREFLEVERRKQRSLARRSARETPLFAPEGGLLAPEVAGAAEVAAGAILGHVTDRTVWHLSARLGGAAPAGGAACAVAGETAGERAPCRVLEVRPTPEGSQLVVAVAAGDGPWLERARSPRVELVAAPHAAGGAP